MQTNSGFEILNRFFHLTADWFFDSSFQVKTRGEVPVRELKIPLELRNYARKYQATPYLILFKALKSIPLAAKEVVLVDLGCGKGRTLVAAGKLGFQKAIGVDISLPLLEQCQTNLEGLDSEIQTQFHLVRMDAARFQPPQDANVYFFFNPFTEEILYPIVRRILNQKKKQYFVVVNPIRKAVFSNCGLTPFAIETSWNPQFVVYLYETRDEAP